jgi:hypothetical protein
MSTQIRKDLDLSIQTHAIIKQAAMGDGTFNKPDASGKPDSEFGR